MNALLDQLELNNSFFIELGIIAVLFVVLSNLFFRPFLKLFEMRNKRTVEDKKAAEILMAQASAKLDEYKRLLEEEKRLAKKEYEIVLTEARKQEAEILAQAREQAKKMTQDAVDSVNRQRENLRKQLDLDVEEVVQNISERLLSRKI